jgi:general secretion pathway protein C
VDFGCDGQTRPDPPPAPPDSPDDLGGAITKLTDTSFDVDVGVIAKMVASPMQLAKSARFVPDVRDGKPHGFKIYALRPSSVFAKLGL